MKSRSLWSHLLLVAGGLVVAAGVGEIAVRLLDRAGWLPGETPAPFAKGPYHGSFRLSSNPRLFVELDPKDPEVNADGFRDRDYPIERTGARRLVVLGDSVAFGFGLPREESFPEVLEQLLDAAPGADPPDEVLNLGVGGYNTLQEVEFYEVVGRKYAPDRIVLAFVLNDCFPSDWMARRGPRPAAFAGAAAAAPLWRHSRLATLVVDRVFRSRDFATRRRILDACAQPELWRIVADGFARLAGIQERDGTPVLVVIVPMLVDFDHYPFADLHRRVRAEAERNGLSTLDLLDAFSRHAASDLRLSPRDPAHPNALGHRIVAEALQRHLTESR
jgi:lysophospholipase L1-like esterase